MTSTQRDILIGVVSTLVGAGLISWLILYGTH